MNDCSTAKIATVVNGIRYRRSMVKRTTKSIKTLSIRYYVNCEDLVVCFGTHLFLFYRRVIKTEHELAALKYAADATCAAHKELMRTVRPGCYEYQLERYG